MGNEEIQINELTVLKQVLSETKRFEAKLKLLIKEQKQSKYNSRQRGPVKRAALDLKVELSRITTATGSSGVYYYNK